MLIGYDPEMLIHFRIFYDCYSGDFLLSGYRQ